MGEASIGLDLAQINLRIADRSDVFYWQTDRAVDPAQAGEIWADRHRYFKDDELIARVSSVLTDPLVELVPLDPDSQESLGNVNSVRVGRLASGREVIVRCHPKGIVNGYFHVEAEAARRAKAAGLPGFETLAVHDFEGGDDFAFAVIEKLEGTAIKKWLDQHPEDEDKLVYKIGEMMANLHHIKVDGFGPFDNQAAVRGKLIGLHTSFADSVRAALPFNLRVLQAENIITEAQSATVAELFENNPLLDVTQAVLVHNDFADWNLLTDGEEVSGLLDWDECVANDPIADIACWSTFFEPERMGKFLEGYWSVAEKPTNFQDKFELLRLRYTLSKMTLRIRRYTWAPTEAVKQRIEVGKNHLRQSMEYFGL